MIYRHAIAPRTSPRQSPNVGRVRPTLVIAIIGLCPLLTAHELTANEPVTIQPGDTRSADSDPSDDGSLTFEQHIRPIFRAHCFDCHGATEDVSGGLDLRLVRFLTKGGDSGPAIVPGKPDESYLLDRIHIGEMPPGDGEIPATEARTIEQWIAAGARTRRPEPDSIGPGLGVSAEERGFWSFQPIQRPAAAAPGMFGTDRRVRTAIDGLILDAFPNSGAFAAAFAPDADRRTLIKRVYFDLTGLPPSPEDMHRWMLDPHGDWYDRLLTEQLESPHYGEYWARHWLDIAGYADSEGYTTNDAVRDWAWKYRDWVIRAINDDLPIDQFITQQLAGDELAGPLAGDLTPSQIQLLTATGFLRMAADGTGSGADNADARNQVMADTLKIIGTSLLGLTLQCAQCHDHRYDPIPQTDYFALRAVFEPALDWQAWKNPNARRVSLYTAADRQRATEIEAEAQKIAADKAAKQAEYMRQALDKELTKFEEPLRSRLRDAYQTAGNQRSDEQKQLLAANPSVNISPGVLYQYLPEAAEDLKTYDQRMADVRSRKAAEEFLRALVEPPNHVPETKLFFRGDHQQPKQTVQPAALTVATPEGEPVLLPDNDPNRPTTGRRLAFAQWLTGNTNPLFARVFVNRIWLHHFGQGIVATPSDFGKLGASPVHHELLDWLAAEFIEHGWSLRHLHRSIMTSTAWRQSAIPSIDVAALIEQSPKRAETTRLLRKPLVRLEAETIRDRMLAASGQLDRTLFGKPLPVKEDDTGQIIVDGTQNRRSLYIQMRRSQPVAMLQAFDAPVMETNCECRPNSTVATQSLMLMNGEFILNQAALLADRADREATPLSAEDRSGLPAMPALPAAEWHYGYGMFDPATNRTETFFPLTHWTGTRWQSGPELPDPKLGYVLLHADGGHPDVPERAVIRRWIAPADGEIRVAGSMIHGAANGNGVRGRIVSNRSGSAGEWMAHNGTTATAVGGIAVQAGDTIDFITDGRGDHTSDSFNWPVTITYTKPGSTERVIVAAEAFRGPVATPTDIPGQVVRVWELAFCRPPSRHELELAMNFLSRQIHTLRSRETPLPEHRTASRQALINLCQSLLSSNEFLYVE